jgi:eukaryotic-like serine/threonine-protein kinase
MTPKTISLFDLAPGKVLLERYRIQKPNRQGGMSTTFEVEDVSGGGPCELQVFPAALFESAQQGREFAAAMNAWKRVETPTVLATREVHTLDDGTALLVTDRPPGVSLREWLREHSRATPAQTIDLGLQLLDGLTAIHGADLVHGDIKPPTIHVEGKKKLSLTLVDGGITPALWSAKHLGDKTALIGTPFYAPIEQFGGEAPNVQSDIYNVATVLFELVTGVIPWKGESFLEIFQAKLDKSAPSMKARAPRVDVTKELEDAIVGGLMADRHQRYPSAEEFKKQLAALRSESSH